MQETASARLEAGLARLGTSEACAHMVVTSRSSEAAVAAGRSFLASHADRHPGVDLVAFGSLGRLELTAVSDLDHLIISHEANGAAGVSEYVNELVPALRDAIGGERGLAPPGATGLFGHEVSAKNFVDVIGLEGDSNHSLSRRILFIEESVSLWRPDLHRELLQALMVRYMGTKTENARVPRFLLNDIVRYWRTLAVDYQAKTPSSYSLRYIKLLLSRKFTFAASVLPLIQFEALQERRPGVAAPEVLAEIFSMPPLVRFTDSALTLDEDDESLSHVRDTLEAMGRGLALLGDGSWRADLRAAADDENPKQTGAFERALDVTTALQDSLGKLFTSHTLLPLTREYLLF